MIIKLGEPLKVNGSSIEELDLQLAQLKGKDLIELETGFRRLYKGEYVPVANIDSRYQIMVAGRVCGVNPKDLEELAAPDFVEVCQAVQNFLLR